jgi:hypothetical protein
LKEIDLLRDRTRLLVVKSLERDRLMVGRFSLMPALRDDRVGLLNGFETEAVAAGWMMLLRGLTVPSNCAVDKSGEVARPTLVVSVVWRMPRVDLDKECTEGWEGWLLEGRLLEGWLLWRISQ